jgi:hypothetical protein
MADIEAEPEVGEGAGERDDLEHHRAGLVARDVVGRLSMGVLQLTRRTRRLDPLMLAAE